MNNVPLIDGVKDYLEKELVPFSMPGHKMGRAFNNELKRIFIEGDLTEVEGLDNLHNPEGIIKDAQDKLSKLYNSEKSYFLVNGSTCGNLIMIFSALNEGDKVLIERNCHRSIMNGIILRKLKPIFIKNKYHNSLKAPIGIDLNHLDEILSEEKNIKAIVLTYPNYYGIGLGIQNIIKICKEKDIAVLIDSAHGAHYGFNKKLPKSPQELGADMVVMSAHKTLPSLTQTSYLHVNNLKYLSKVEFYKGIFMSTSPSYMMMMSLDYARNFLEKEGENEYNNLINVINTFNEKARGISYLNIVGKIFLCHNCKEKENAVCSKCDLSYDPSRIILNLKEGFNGNKLLDYLLKNKVQCEMSDNKNVVLIPSPFNTKKDFETLYEALLKCDENELIFKEKDFYSIDIPKCKFTPYEVIDKEVEELDLDKAVGRVIAENIIPYPPGVPMLISGEVIENRHIEYIKNYINEKITVIGISNHYIKVVKSDD
ncbi:MAG: aminotransferase class V-fold PLP-dependent enzyme [Clostridium perfringens]|nr:aminotransferase class V-fold PLP-dependent enzyme [Clostridium perfringens]